MQKIGFWDLETTDTSQRIKLERFLCRAHFAFVLQRNLGAKIEN